jgi:transcriptional regulator with XRE-family HTH domain
MTGALAPVSLAIPGLSLRILRRWRDMKQADVGRLLGMSCAQVSRVESGRQVLRAEKWHEACVALALGKRDRGVDRPLFVMASWEDFSDHGRLTILLDGSAVGLFLEQPVAISAAAFLDSLVPPPIVPVPVWPAFFDEQQFAGRLDPVLVTTQGERVAGACVQECGPVVAARDHIIALMREEIPRLCDS